MARTTVVVIGAGQAGLAVSHLLTAGSVDHVVLERGRVAERWLSQRWDSLRLLTPSWLVRLPGGQYTGPEPDGYLAAREVAAHLAGYAAPAPVRTHTEVLSVCRTDDGYRTVTTDGTWSSDAVVVATGHSAAAHPWRATSRRPWSSRTPTPTGVPVTCPTAGCSSWAPRPPGCSSPTRSPEAAGR